MAAVKEQSRAPSSESLEAGYETSTISVKGLGWFVIFLVATAAVIHTATWFLFVGYIKFDERQEKPFSALTDQASLDRYNRDRGAHLAAAEVPLPPPPRLQPTAPAHNLPEDDLRSMYRSENEIFHRMGWQTDDREPFRLQIPAGVVESVVRQESQEHQHGEKK